MDYLARVEQDLEDDLFAGRISQADFNVEMRHLHLEYQADIEAEAQEAYDAVMAAERDWSYDHR